ncbi:MAG: hypothetical protein M0024_00970 [Nitrospiraceae bacterium]|nr:hypothetical protein [Nitrospiraceae bacterium]
MITVPGKTVVIFPDSEKTMLSKNENMGQEQDHESSVETAWIFPRGSWLDKRLSDGFERTEGFLSRYLKHIDFRYCYYALLGGACSVVLSFILWRITFIPAILLQVLQQISVLLINLYVNMGYIKYSYLEDERLFRRVMIVAAGLSLLGSALLVLAPLLPVGKTQSTIFIALPVYVTAPLLFYGFRLIRTEERSFFTLLARLNLVLFLAGILWAFLFIPWLSSYPLIFLLTVASGVMFVSIWFMKLRLFHRLSEKWPGLAMPAKPAPGTAG